MLRFGGRVVQGCLLLESLGRLIQVMQVLRACDWVLLMCYRMSPILGHALHTCNGMRVRLRLIQLVQEVVCHYGLPKGDRLIVVLGVNQSLLYCVLHCLFEAYLAN